MNAKRSTTGRSQGDEAHFLSTRLARRKSESRYLVSYDSLDLPLSAELSLNYVPQPTNRFVWDGQVLLAVLDCNNQPVTTLLRGLDLSGTMQGAGGVVTISVKGSELGRYELDTGSKADSADAKRN